MDPYTAGTIIRTILQSTGPKVGIFVLVLAGLAFAMFKVWQARTRAAELAEVDRQARAALHIQRDAEEDKRMAGERTAQTAFLQEQVRTSQEREVQFVKVLTESAATMAGIHQALQQTMTQSADRHAKTMAKLEELHRDMPRRIA